MLKEEVFSKIKSATIKEDRKAILEPLANYLNQKLEKEEEINLNFICTHNSRRSQFAQFWSTYFSFLLKLPIHSYSGGTEKTQVHPNVIGSLKRMGFEVKENAKVKKNPFYIISFDESNQIELHSKLFSEAIQGKGKFAALMCCSEAGENCPFVPGTEVTVPLYYEDPKISDGTAKENEIYDERSLQIASEIFFVLSNLNS